MPYTKRVIDPVDKDQKSGGHPRIPNRYVRSVNHWLPAGFGWVSALAVCACSITPEADVRQEKFFGDTLSSHAVDRIVAVAHGRPGALGHSSGFLIDPTNVLTNRHVANEGAVNIVRVMPPGASQQGGDVVTVTGVIPCTLPDCDLAILRLSRPLQANWEFSLSSSAAEEMQGVHIASHHNYHGSTRRPDGNPSYSTPQFGFLSAALTAHTIYSVGDGFLGFSEWGVSDINESGRQPFDQVFVHKGDSGSAVVSLSPPRMVGVIFYMSSATAGMVDVRRPEIQAWIQANSAVTVDRSSSPSVPGPGTPRADPPARRAPCAYDILWSGTPDNQRIYAQGRPEDLQECCRHIVTERQSIFPPAQAGRFFSVCLEEPGTPPSLFVCGFIQDQDTLRLAHSSLLPCPTTSECGSYDPRSRSCVADQQR